MADAADELRELAAALKTAGDKVMRKEVIDTLKAEAKPLGESAMRNAGATLPRRGGLAEVVAATPVTVKVRLGGRQAGITLVGRGRVGIASIDEGTLRHPLYGNRAFWFSQSVRPGWWSETISRGAPQVAMKLEEAIAAGLQRAVGE